MTKRNSGSSLYRLKKLAERMQQPGLSPYEKVALQSRYSELAEEIRERASH